MPKPLLYFFIFVFGSTSVVWVAGITNHTFLASEFWIYVGIFFLPASAVCVCAWLALRDLLWIRDTGLVLLFPALAMWVISLLLVFNGFRIH